MTDSTNRRAPRQLVGGAAILDAIAQGTHPTFVLLAEPVQDTLTTVLDAAGIPWAPATDQDLWRMSRAAGTTDALALVGRRLHGDLTSLMNDHGAVWLLASVSYPSNVGTIIRSVEVTGALGVVVDGEFNRPARRRAQRVSMRADRFLSVFWDSAERTVEAAHQAGRRVVAVESTGDALPWEVDLTGDVLLIAGGERHGIPSTVLNSADHVVRLPTPGFVPSWNVQAAVAAVASERLRQWSLVSPQT